MWRIPPAFLLGPLEFREAAGVRKEVLPASLNLRVSPVNLSCVLTLIVVEINTPILATSRERIVSQTSTCSGNSRVSYVLFLFYSVISPRGVIGWVGRSAFWVGFFLFFI